MQVGIYPTRDFATLGTLLPPQFPSGRAGHFCQPLHVAMQVGPSHLAPSKSESGVWSLRIPSQLLLQWGVYNLGRSFLLIARTGHIVTPTHSDRGSAGYSGIPAYSQILQRPNRLSGSQRRKTFHVPIHTLFG